jgi:RNA polymerase sigma factor (sigma-70 family)
VRHDGDAQDALQSTFAGALAALRRGGRDAPLRPWLFRIAHNESISLLRRRRVTVELSETALQATPAAEEIAFEKLALASLLTDLGELGDRQRAALVMRELSGLSHEEIAIALTTSVGGAKQAIFDARRALAELAEGRAMQCEDVRRAISDDDGRVLRGRRVRAHLRDCSGCAAFAAAIPARRDQLRALAVPLAPIAAGALLGHVVAASSGHGGANTALAVSAAGKSAGTAIATKALVGIAVLAAGTVGVTRVLPSSRHHTHASSRAAPISSSRSGTGGAAPNGSAARTQTPSEGTRSAGAVAARSDMRPSPARPGAQASSSRALADKPATRAGRPATAHRTPTRPSRARPVHPAARSHGAPAGRPRHSNRTAQTPPSSGSRRSSTSAPSTASTHPTGPPAGGQGSSNATPSAPPPTTSGSSRHSSTPQIGADSHPTGT